MRNSSKLLSDDFVFQKLWGRLHDELYSDLRGKFMPSAGQNLNDYFT